MVKHTETIPRQQAVNCLSVFDYFAGLALKELIDFIGYRCDANVSFKDVFSIYAVIFWNMFHQVYLQQM